jgi:hypothetical protein
MGNATWLASTGNELIANGLLVTKPDRTSAQILEVAPDGTRLFELDIGGNAANSWYLMHRARRIADVRQ